MNKLLKWIENLWQLREIFDKYLPMVKVHRDAIRETFAILRSLQAELDAIKEKQAIQQNQLDTNFTILSDLGGSEVTKNIKNQELASAVESAYNGVVSK